MRSPAAGRTAVAALRRGVLLLGMLGAAVLHASPTSAGAADLELSLDEVGPGWSHVTLIENGFRGRAAEFAVPEARIDAGPCGVTSAEPFTLLASIKTSSAAFSTALIAREGAGAVGFALVTGREPGRVSFEAWSWSSVRLISRSRIDDGAWHRVEAAYDPISHFAVLLVDGRPEASGNLGEGSAPRATLRLGNNIGADQPFVGALDDVRVLRRTTRPEMFRELAPVLSDARHRRELLALRERLLPRRTPMPADAAAWASRRAVIQAGIADALALPFPASRIPLHPRGHGSLSAEGLHVERISWDTGPGARGTGWLWTPSPKPKGRLPAVLSPHGHWAGGAIDPVVQARAASLARQGYVVLVPDSVHVEDVASGVSAIGTMTRRNLLALDLLAERPDVDSARIGVTGASGGAQQTLYLMALSDRVAAAAPICYVSYLTDILFEDTAHCTCNHAPLIATVADEPEIAATFSPRPALFGSVTGDWTSTFPEKVLPDIRRLYALGGSVDGAAPLVESMHRREGHNYGRGFREAVYAFFRRTLRHEEGEVVEAAFSALPLETLRAIDDPDATPDVRALAREALAVRGRAADWRTVAPGLPWKVERAPLVAAEPAVEGTRWLRGSVTGSDGVAIPVVWHDDTDSTDAPWILAVSSGGKAALALESPAWLSHAPRVALVDPRFVGEWSPFVAGWRRNGLMLGRGEGYEAAHDLALVAQSLPGKSPVTLVALGSTGVSGLLATGLSPRIRTFVANDLGPRFADDGNRLPFFPEILRRGDLPELVAAAPASVTMTVGGLGPSSAIAVPVASTWKTLAKPLSDAEIEAAIRAP